MVPSSPAEASEPQDTVTVDATRTDAAVVTYVPMPMPELQEPLLLPAAEQGGQPGKLVPAAAEGKR